MKGTVLFHVSGTGGDLLSSAWTNDSEIVSATEAVRINDSGRVVIEWNQFVLDMFPKQPSKHWYAREWSESELNTLGNLSKQFFINSTDIEQAKKIKSYFGNTVSLVGINYVEKQWDYVLDSFCSKVLDSDDYLTKDDVGENFLNVVAKTTEERDSFIKMGKNKQLGAWYKELAVNNLVQFPPKSSKLDFDISVELVDLFTYETFTNVVTTQLQRPLTQSLISLYKHWLPKQKI